MVPGNEFGIFHGSSHKVLGQGEQLLSQILWLHEYHMVSPGSTWIHPRKTQENKGKHISNNIRQYQIISDNGKEWEYK